MRSPVFTALFLVTHEAVTAQAGIRARGAIHIRHVNGWRSRFKDWLRRFKGIAGRQPVGLPN